jgi:hypothetical protein
LSDGFVQAYLPDVEKRRLCEELLHEFGVGKITVVEHSGEMRHGCMLPGGNHSDQIANPTGSLNFKKLTYKCLGCSQSGGLLWFIGIMRGCTGRQARQWLAKETGTEGNVSSLGKLLELFDSIYSEKRTRPSIPVMSQNILKPWLFIHPYMTETRKVDLETLFHFQVGYGEFEVGPPEARMKSKRIVIPHIWKNNLVGWQTRRLYNDGTAKYLNSPDFPRDSTIYNYDGRRDYAIDVESPMSVLRHFNNEPGFEATFGASVSDSQLVPMRMHRRHILFPDNGSAGWDSYVTGVYSDSFKARKKKIVRPSLAEQLSSYCDVKVVFNPYVDYDEDGNVIWLDPADLDWQTVQQLLDDALPYSVWSPPTTADLQKYVPKE